MENFGCPLERAPHPFVRKRTFPLTGESSHGNYNWVWAKPTINSQFSTLNSPLNKGENYEHLA